MMRILYLASEPSQCVSYWRGLGLFVDLMRACPGEYDVIQVGEREMNWWDIRRADMLWFTRPSIADFEPFFRMAQTQGVPIVVDWDDLFLSIPPGNPVGNHVTLECAQMSARYMARATICTVSTPQLAESFKARGLTAPIRVLPNALTDRYRWAKQGPPTKTILWRGSATHDADIDGVGDDIVALNEEFTDWNWVFAGADPWRITKRLRPGSWTSFGVQPMAYYHHTIVGLCPSIIMSPLQDNEFNRCKSRIGVIEAAMAGGTFVCPDFPALNEPPSAAMRYQHPSSGPLSRPTFGERMRGLLGEPLERLRFRAVAARDIIDSQERTRHVLPILKSILESAVNHAECDI